MVRATFPYILVLAESALVPGFQKYLNCSRLAERDGVRVSGSEGFPMVPEWAVPKKWVHLSKG